MCAHRHGRVELVVHLGLESHHWLLVTEPLLGVRVGGWHLSAAAAVLETPSKVLLTRLRLLQRGMVLPVMLGAVAQQQHSVKINNNERVTIHTIA